MLPLTLTALALIAAVDPEPADANLTKIVARSPWPHAPVKVKAAGKDKVQLVIRSAAELVAAVPGSVEKAATADLAKELKVKDIDWAKQMVVVVSGGTKSSGGYRAEVTGLEIKGETMTVKWTLHSPKGRATRALTHPSEVVLVPKFMGKVVFDRNAWYALLDYRNLLPPERQGGPPGWLPHSRRLGPFKRPRDAMVEMEREATFLKNRHGENILFGDQLWAEPGNGVA